MTVTKECPEPNNCAVDGRCGEEPSPDWIEEAAKKATLACERRHYSDTLKDSVVAIIRKYWKGER